MDTAGAPLIDDGFEPQPRSEKPALRQERPLTARLFSAGEIAEGLRFEWARLVAEASEPNAFAEHWFVAAGLRHLGGSSEVHIAEVRSGPLLIGLLPLVIAPRYGRIPVAHVENWLHFHSFLGTPLVRNGYEQRFWSALLELLDKALWARNFLHVTSLVEGGPVHQGLIAAATAVRRSCDVVHRTERALLASDLTPAEYYERTVRKKKRKELKRLQNRLAELGQLTTRAFTSKEDIGSWCDDFLALERSGWKGKAGSALSCHGDTELFLREAVADAQRCGRLQFLRLELAGRPLAMLINFLTPPGSFSFKIAFDEEYARFSPGVLLELDNLKILDRPDIGWMDSCAAENHPMINSLWAERRAIVRVTVPLAGARRRTVFHASRAIEKSWARIKSLSSLQGQPRQDHDDHD